MTTLAPAERGPVPADWSQTIADLRAETAYLARALGQPIVRTPNATGILNLQARSAVWVLGPLQLQELLDEVHAHRPHPEIRVPAHLRVDVQALAASGLNLQSQVHRIRRDLRPRTAEPPQTDVELVLAGQADLPALRRLHDRVYGIGDALTYLPGDVIEVPGLRIIAALDGGDLVAMAGVRLRHAGALIFGLVTDPEHHGRGFASAVVGACLRWAAEEGASFAIADVERPDGSVWLRHGFQSTGAWDTWTTY